MKNSLKITTAKKSAKTIRCASTSVILAVFLWVSAELHAPLDKQPPAVVCDSTMLMEVSRGQSRVLGAFDKKTVILPTHFTGESVAEQAVMVHEFTHKVQENAAYYLQAKYIATHSEGSAP